MSAPPPPLRWWRRRFFYLRLGCLTRSGFHRAVDELLAHYQEGAQLSADLVHFFESEQFRVNYWVHEHPHAWRALAEGGGKIDLGRYTRREALHELALTVPNSRLLYVDDVYHYLIYTTRA